MPQARADGSDGSDTARDRRSAALADELAAAPDARIVVLVVGARGAGKSALLDDLAGRLLEGGHDVRRTLGDLDRRSADGRMVLLVDDAHAMGDSAVQRLRELLDDERVSLVLGCRPWPSSPAFAEVKRLCAAKHPPVVLGPLTHDEVRGLADRRLGRVLTDAQVGTLTAQTGGVPWLVDRLLTGVQEEGPSMLEAPSSALLTRLGHDLQGLDGASSAVRDLLLALAVGFDPGCPAVQRWRRLAGEDVRALAERAQAVGVLTPDSRLPPLLGRALLAVTAPGRIGTTQAELLDAAEASGWPLLDTARMLVARGMQDPRLAAELERAAEAALDDDPSLAGVLFREALAAGADRGRTAARRAQAAWASGDLDEAARVADRLFAEGEPHDLRRASDVAAAVWAARGMLTRGADVYRWLEPARAGSSAALAAVALFGVGDAAGAAAMLEAPGRAAPTSLAVALTDMADGVRQSILGPVDRALPALVRASETMTATGVAVPMPDTPAALAGLVAIHGGDLAMAARVLDSALQGGQGRGPFDARLRLLRAWVAMLRDDLARAAETVAALDPSRLPGRDALLYHALEVGVARRSDELTELAAAWQRSRELLLGVPVDLYALLPLAELRIAAARVRDSASIASHAAEADALLARLGDPPLWSAHHHWSAVQAGILAESPDDLRPHAAALVAASGRSRMAAVFSAAGRAWVTVLGGRVEPDAVESAARGLAEAGLPWDGARLAGHAAARAGDRRHMVRLLACARELHPRTGAGPAPDGRAAAHDAPPPRPDGRTDEALSGREREIARLVLDGKTYVEIGKAVFISPRTAEHHMARIRRRLGVSTRSEMLERLRVVLDDPESR